MTALCRPSTSRTAALLSGSAVVAASLAAAPAMADTRVQVRVSGGLNAESSPFLREDDTGTAVGVTAEVEPSIVSTTERTTFRLSGAFRFDQYNNNINNNESVLLTANGSTRLDERTSLSAGARFQSSQAASLYNILSGPIGVGVDGGIGVLPTLPITGPLPGPVVGDLPLFPDVDPTIAGRRLRVTSTTFDASVQRQLSPQDGLTFGILAQDSQTDGDVGFDYRRVGLQAGYVRQLTERTAARANVNVTKYDLHNQQAGDAISITPLVGLSQRLNERLSWTGQVGIAYTRIDDALGGSDSNVGFAANFNLCNQGVRDSLCVSAARDAAPTTFRGLTTSTTLAVQYSRQLSQYDLLTGVASYRRSEQLSDAITQQAGTDELVAAGLRYRRQFSDRFSGFVDASYSKVFSDILIDNRDNIRGSIGLSYVFGEIR